MSFNFQAIGDSFQSLLTGLGIMGRDKVLGMKPKLQPWEMLTWDKNGLDALYRTDWMARKIVDIPAFDACRAWRNWTGSQDQIEKLKETEKAFGLQRKMLSAMTKARLYGGACMVIGCDDGTFETELNLDKVKKGSLKFIHVVEKWMIGTGPRVRDITSPWFGEPNYYMRSNIPVTEAPGGVQQLPTGFNELVNKSSSAIYIHPSRVVRLVGLDYPDIEMAEDAWGDSALQPIYQALRSAGLVTGSLANTVADSKVDVYRIPGLISQLSTTQGTTQVMNYLTNANTAKSILNALVMDKEIEWDRIETHYEGMPKVLESYLLICAAAGDIPSTRLLSREPSGMNATGDSDTRNYYDRLHADQTVRITPLMSRLDEVLIRHTFGSRDPSITYEWNSLWQLSDDEKSKIALAKAQAFQIDNNSGLFPPAALATARQNQLIQDGTYPGLDQALEEWQDEQDLNELNDPTPQPGDPDYVDPNKSDNDNDPDNTDNGSGNGSSSSQKIHLKISAGDEDVGHPFRGNQYATGESGGAAQPQAKGSRPQGPVKQLMQARITHSKYEHYARATRRLVRMRSEKEHAAKEAAIRQAYYRNGAAAKRFAEEPLSHKIFTLVAHQFVSEHPEVKEKLGYKHRAAHVGAFAGRNLVGLIHEVAVDKYVVPAVEAAVVAGMTELGGAEGGLITSVAIEVASFAAKQLMERAPVVGPEHAIELLKHAAHALSVGWHAAYLHVHKDGLLTDAEDHAQMLRALSAFEEALRIYEQHPPETST